MPNSNQRELQTAALDFYEALGSTREEIVEIISNKEKYYISYPIIKKARKKDGTFKKRFIDAPQGRLKEIQTRILKRILYRFSAHPIAHGFVRHRSPKTAAEIHVGAKVLVILDIHNFFNSITYVHIVGLLSTLLNRREMFNYSDIEIKFLAELLTYRGRVPQGAPTSPTISNLVCLRLDKNLSRLQPIYKCKVTRYADDLVFSSTENIYLPKIIPAALSYLRQEGFIANKTKTRVVKRNKAMTIMGVTVNNKLNVPSKNWRNFRAKLHQLVKADEPITKEEYQKLRGYIEWVASLNPSRGQQFLSELGKLHYHDV